MGMIFQPLLSTSDGVLTVTHLTFRLAVGLWKLKLYFLDTFLQMIIKLIIKEK